MTIWTPELRGAGAPKYMAIADAIARDIAAGALQPGARLPTHRELADRLGVTVGTVSRAYAEAQRRGLVLGEVGRGTFVRQLSASPVEFGVPRRKAPPDRDLIDLSFNSPAVASACPELAAALASLAGPDRLAGILRYQPGAGDERHRRAGAQWMGYAGLTADPGEIVVTAGAQHAMLLAFTALAQPGDLILTEPLTYPGMSALARFLRLRLQAVAMDEHGVRPDRLDQACRRGRVKALYLTPTIQNPTAASMPESRRREIAAIARAHGVFIVEDDIYAHLMAEAPRPIAAFAPELCLRVDGLSKSVAPGLRVGFLRAPASAVESVIAALMTTTIMASPLTAEIAATIIEDGTAARIVARRRDEIAERQRLARGILGRHIAARCRRESMHVWLELPEPWRAEEFATQARRRGVLVASAELFAVGHSAAPHAVRLSLAAVEDLAVLQRGLDSLAELLLGAPTPQLARV